MAGDLAPILAFEGFELDGHRRMLMRANGDIVPLGAKPFEALLYLVSHAGTRVSKQELMRAIWPDVTVEENSLSQCISTVRRALGEAPGEHRYIVTKPARGYRFVARVLPVTSTPGGTRSPARVGGRSSAASSNSNARPASTRTLLWPMPVSAVPMR